MRHPKLEAWEANLKTVLDALDDHLEDRFGKDFPLHPSRAQRGDTSNKAHDGLFDIVGAYTLGTGSRYGKGYVIDVNMVTLEAVPQDVKREIEKITIQKLEAELPTHFPGTDLKVHKDGNVIKIHGDLSLGEA